MVDTFHLDIVENFHSGELDSFANHFGHTLGGGMNAGERGNGNTLVFGNDGHFQGGFGDDSQSPFTTNEQLGQVVTCTRLPGAPTGLDDGAIRENNSEGDNPISHRTVLISVGARAASANHAANFGTRTRVWREEHAVIMEIFIQVLPAESRLYNNVEIFGVEFENLVHSAEVNADTSSCGCKVTFETRPSAQGCDGDLALVADFHNLGDFFGVCRVDDKERLFVGLGFIRGPVGARVGLEIAVEGGNMLLADNQSYVGPRSLEDGGSCIVLRRWRFRQGSGRGAVKGFLPNAS